MPLYVVHPECFPRHVVEYMFLPCNSMNGLLDVIVHFFRLREEKTRPDLTQQRLHVKYYQNLETLSSCAQI